MINNQKQVPAVVIKRLPRYYRYLSELLKLDIKRISSGDLSKKMNVTASQIRQDFNYFGGFGQQGYGYNVEYLYNVIGEILGLNNENRAIVVGAGNLGKALANHDAFERRGFKILALFDVKPEVCGTEVNGKMVLPLDRLESFITDNNINIGILTVPSSFVKETANRLVAAGVQGMLNFGYTELESDFGVPVENVHLSDALMTLSYKLKK